MSNSLNPLSITNLHTVYPFDYSTETGETPTISCLPVDDFIPDPSEFPDLPNHIVDVLNPRQPKAANSLNNSMQLTNDFASKAIDQQLAFSYQTTNDASITSVDFPFQTGPQTALELTSTVAHRALKNARNPQGKGIHTITEEERRERWRMYQKRHRAKIMSNSLNPLSITNLHTVYPFDCSTETGETPTISCLPVDDFIPDPSEFPDFPNHIVDVLNPSQPKAANSLNNSMRLTNDLASKAIDQQLAFSYQTTNDASITSVDFPFQTGPQTALELTSTVAHRALKNARNPQGKGIHTITEEERRERWKMYQKRHRAKIQQAEVGEPRLPQQPRKNTNKAPIDPERKKVNQKRWKAKQKDKLGDEEYRKQEGEYKKKWTAQKKETIGDEAYREQERLRSRKSSAQKRAKIGDEAFRRQQREAQAKCRAQQKTKLSQTE